MEKIAQTSKNSVCVCVFTIPRAFYAANAMRFLVLECNLKQVIRRNEQNTRQYLVGTVGLIQHKCKMDWGKSLFTDLCTWWPNKVAAQQVERSQNRPTKKKKWIRRHTNSNCNKMSNHQWSLHTSSATENELSPFTTYIEYTHRDKYIIYIYYIPYTLYSKSYFWDL